LRPKKAIFETIIKIVILIIMFVVLILVIIAVMVFLVIMYIMVFMFILLRKRKNWPKANFFFKQIGIFRKKDFPYEKLSY
jgi:hypothetical protein